jgi:hypothetical protein
VFPALWGKDSYNCGAGTGSVSNAAALVKANMSRGLGGTLGDQDSWDVAYFVDADERPQDPCFVDPIAATRAKFHNSRYSLYGETVNSRVVGAGTDSGNLTRAAHAVAQPICGQIRCRSVAPAAPILTLRVRWLPSFVARIV